MNAVLFSSPPSRTLLAVASLLLSAFTGLRAAEPVAITEFMADNHSGLLDEDGATSDWIELQNTSASPVNLDGWYLTDDAAVLNKWRFPNTNLAGGKFLVVFASGKDRAVPGTNLHTSFLLSSTGGYLALVKPDGVTIATKFDPYPEQAADVSYGLAQNIIVNRFVGTNSPARAFVPVDATLGSTWIGGGFDDSGWIAGTNGVGYETTVPGFAVRNFKANITVDSLVAAEGVITNAAQQTAGYSENVATINYLNTGVGANYLSDRTFPGLTINVDADNFVLEATAIITITNAGNWTFGVNSDDGFRLTIGGFTMAFPTPRGPGDTLATFNFPTAGDYPLRLVFYEQGGGSEVELYAAKGSFTTWNATNFRLVGDVARSGLAIRSASGGGAGYRSMIATDVQSQMLSNNATAYVRLPFTVTNPAGYTALTLAMKYDDGFVAHLNGSEIARRNAPVTPAWNSTATAAHSATTAENIDVTAALPLLQSGNNVLAIQGLNDAANGTDFFLFADLAEVKSVGTTNVYFGTPTPGSVNLDSFVAFVADTKFSHNRGFYETNFTLTITCDTPGATIRYTTNGSTPSLSNGTDYTVPLPVSRTTTLRAAAFRTGFRPADVDTHTYVFVRDVINQSPTGLAPTPEWPAPPRVNGQLIDYGMDPQVVTNALYKNTLTNDLKSIPSFSIVTDLKHLFDPATGIYANPSGDEIAWERPTSLELIYPDGRKGFHINCGVRIRGGFSRSTDNPKHAFRFFFRQEYGASKLNFPLVGPEGADSFDKFDLRTMQNYSWSFGGDSRMVCLRDLLSRDAQIAMGQPATRGDFFHLYLNGVYWGLYNIEERPEAGYGESYFGGQAEDYDTIKIDPDNGYNVEPTDGNLNAWQRLWQQATNGFASDAAYQKVQGNNPDGSRNPALENLVDVPNLIDYMLVIIYGGNLDAPISNFLGNSSPNNWFGIRSTNGTAGFRFFAHDSEHTLLDINEDRTGIQNGVISYSAGNPAQGSAFSKSNPQYIWFRLQQNPEFRLFCADRIQKHFFNGGAMTTNALIGRFLSRSNEIQRAIVCESARWGDAKREPAYTRNDWVAAMGVVYQHLLQRGNVVLNQLRADSLLPFLNAPGFSKFGGVVSPGFNLTMSNPNATGTIYYTLDGSDPRLRGGAVSASALAYTGPITLDSSVVVRARVLSNTVWSAQVAATFYVLQDLSALRITEVMYNPAPGGFEFIELHNNSATATLDLSGVQFTQGINYTFSNDVTIPPGGYLILTKAASSNNFAAFRAYYGLDASVPIFGPFNGSLDNGGEQLTLRSVTTGTNVVSFTYSDGRGWPLAADGAGASLVLLDDAEALQGTGSAEYGSNWRASTWLRGSPGRADQPVPPGVVLNEITANTDPEGGFESNDWIELFNPTANDITLGAGWYLSDDGALLTKWAVPSNTMVAAHGFVSFDEITGFHNPTNIGFGLNRLGEQVFLSYLPGNAQDRIVDSVSFKAQAAGWSWGRYRDGGLWGPSNVRTRNAVNHAPSFPVVINEVMYHPPDIGGTNDNSLEEFVELQNVNGTPLPLFNPDGVWRLNGSVSFDLPTNLTLNAGQYLLVVNFNPTNTVDLANFKSRFGIVDPSLVIVGPYQNKLPNGSGRVSLEYPVAPTPPDTALGWVLVDEVTYADQPPWPCGSDGSGFSLNRAAAAVSGNDPLNWYSAAPSAGQANAAPPPVPPAIVAQPLNRAAILGGRAAFIVTACGTPPLSYQWRFNDASLPGATGTVLELQPVQASQVGLYTVVVTNLSGSVTSSPALLITAAPIVIMSQPTNTAVVGFQDTMFSVMATSVGPLRYQWSFNGANLPNATNATLLLSNAQPAQAGSYSVLVFNAGGSVASLPATLTVNFPPVILQPPVSVTTNPGSNVTFKVDAIGTGPLRYQWRYFGTNLPNATTNILSLTNVQLAVAGPYTVLLTDNVGPILSPAANLLVLVKPFFITQPQGATVFVGDTVSLSVTAGPIHPSLPLAYKWRRNGLTLTNNATTFGATTPVLTLLNVQTNQAGSYTALLTNLASAGVLSSPAALTVLVDSDGDRIPDDWEIRFGLDPNVADGALDSDGDGVSNLAEYIAGTDPKDPLSYLKIDSISAGGGVTLLSFMAVSNKTYSVQRSDAVAGSAWLLVTNVPARTNTHVETITDSSNAGSRRFYRLATPQLP